MAFTQLNFVFILFFVLCSSVPILVSAEKKSYIVYLGSHAHGPDVSVARLKEVTNKHHEFLGSFLGSTDKARDSIFHSYTKHINGFAAKLEEEEAAELARKGHYTRQLHGSSCHWRNGIIPPKSAWKQAHFGAGVIIGNLDSGVWPESRSFNDDSYGPVPSKWKGTCQNDTNGVFPCNRKLIGARYFSEGAIAAGGDIDPSELSPRDFEGHGTHTLSTAAGNFVPEAEFYGVPGLTVKGGAPRARVAAYKACWENGCFDSDFMQAFDAAIHDGVDVISISAGMPPVDYIYDVTAIGAFHAVKNGILLVASGGNSGPTPGTITNVAPWILTVAASTMDREFENFVELGDGKRFQGASITGSTNENQLYPLITATEAKLANASTEHARLCLRRTLDPEKVKGKILVCLRGITDRTIKSNRAMEAGAVGMIMYNNKTDYDNLIHDDPHYIPSSHISYEHGLAVLEYINTTRNPTAFISAAKPKLHVMPSPMMSDFSSRGPNIVTPDILKPDVTAPGVNIIAACSPKGSGSEYQDDTRAVNYAMISGTSMSCPHVSGVAALLRELHPDWSVAAIKSAIITTARTRENTENVMLNNDNRTKATPFGYGSGHVRPNRAMDPGLVYDMSTKDYMDFLCAIGYNKTLMSRFSDSPYECHAYTSLLDFNYRSFTVSKLCGKVTMTRRVKNVGTPGTYIAHVREPYGISVAVEPSVLKFTSVGEENSFKVTLQAKWDGAAKHYEFGGLTWTDGQHFIRSPIVVASH